MSAHSFAGQPIFNRRSTDIEGFNSLAELALNLRYLWNSVAVSGPKQGRTGDAEED
jgi:hypothetical protein